MAKETTYTEDNIRSLDWKEHIRMRPGMYIGKLGDGSSPDDGIYILLKEVLDNSIDEYVMGAGKTIDISIRDQQVTVRDYGRGIPLGKVVDVVSKMNTGGKYDSKAFKKSVGLNGVGTKAVNALSAHFKVQSVRDSKTAYAEFERGDLTLNEAAQESSLRKGTKVQFIPDEKIFGKYKYRSEYVAKMLKNYVYLNTGLTIIFNGEKFFSENGLKDLLVSSQGQYNEITESQISKISYYENIGTADTPLFEFVTDDYEDLSTMGIGESLVFYPSFADLDGDGDEDMILGEYIGYCYYLENTGGAGSPAIFNTFSILLDNEGSAIFDGTYCYPHLIDLDRDGDSDLVVGRRTGKLQYFENTGVGSYNFEFVTSNLGGVDVSGEGFIEGHAIPQFVDVDGEYHLLVGSKRGYVYYFDDIEDNLDGTFHLVDSVVDNINIGTYSAPTVANINDNNRLEMVLGNRRGGVVLYESAPTSNIGLESLDDSGDILIYPNPANDNITIQLGALTVGELKMTTILIYSVTGELLSTIQPKANTISIDLRNYAKGTYLINVVDGEKSTKKKLVIY